MMTVDGHFHSKRGSAHARTMRGIQHGGYNDWGLDIDPGIPPSPEPCHTPEEEREIASRDRHYQTNREDWSPDGPYHEGV